MLHMKYRTRIQYTETDKALMWERWRQGESLNAIARLFDRNHSAIGGILSRTGGIRTPAATSFALGARFGRTRRGLGPAGACALRRSRHHTQKTPDHGRITATVSIRERPAETEDRAVPGHWEGRDGI
jgi:IS30 family transposase